MGVPIGPPHEEFAGLEKPMIGALVLRSSIGCRGGWLVVVRRCAAKKSATSGLRLEVGFVEVMLAFGVRGPEVTIVGLVVMLASGIGGLMLAGVVGTMDLRNSICAVRTRISL